MPVDSHSSPSGADQPPTDSHTTDPVILSPADTFRQPSPSSKVWRKLLHDRAAMIGLALILIVITISIFAPFVCPYQPDTVLSSADGLALGLDADTKPIAPNDTWRWGADTLGRDVMTRVFYGGRISLIVALVSNIIAIVLGVAVGVLAGYFGGFVDMVLSRLIEIMLAFPIILFAIALAAALKPSLGVVIVSISLVSWTTVARVVRGQVLALKNREFIEAARAVGVKSGRIMFRHIAPHLVSPLLVIMALAIPNTVVLEAALSFLGVGIPPDVPSWGNMLNEGTRYYISAPWIVLFPGLAVFITVLGFNLFGDGVRDALDPRYQQR